jgi:hypothetical protein
VYADTTPHNYTGGSLDRRIYAGTVPHSLEERTHQMDPATREYAAAVAGMQDTYGKPLPEPGDAVTGTAVGKRFEGVVLASGPGRVVVEIDGAWIVCRPTDLD